MHRRIYTLFLLYSLLTGTSLFLVSCGGAYVGYKPPVIPLEISVDTNGNISVSVNTSIVTPIGTFSMGAYAIPSEYFKTKGSLTIRLDGKDTIYPLDGENFNINFESGYYEKVKIEKNDSNILLELRRASTIGARALSPDEEYCLSLIRTTSESCWTGKSYVDRKMYRSQNETTSEVFTGTVLLSIENGNITGRGIKVNDCSDKIITGTISGETVYAVTETKGGCCDGSISIDHGTINQEHTIISGTFEPNNINYDCLGTWGKYVLTRIR